MEKAKHFGSGELHIGGKVYPITNVVVTMTSGPVEIDESDLQELGARHFERLCADAGVKCTRLERGDA